MRLLVVEDSDVLRESLATGLRDAGYAVDTASDGEQGLWLGRETPYETVILDIQLPRMNGLDVLDSLRGDGSKVPVLMLTARDTVADRVRGLRGGADDYLVKPFDFEELLARVEALSRRRHGEVRNRVTAGPLTLDLDRKRVALDDADLSLPPRQYALLEYLVLNRHRVVTRAEIERHLYDDGVELMSNVIDSAISSLRRAIDRRGETSLIGTRRGLGYQLNAT